MVARGGAGARLAELDAPGRDEIYGNVHDGETSARGICASNL